MGAMTTPSAFARNATKALQQMVDVSSGGLDCEGAAAIVEEAISRAMRDRDVTAHRELKAAHAAADERLMQLLSASPAVIYSYKAIGDFAPTFVSGNIVDVFGYSTSEYLCDPSFWSARVHEDGQGPRRSGNRKLLQEWRSCGGVSLPPQGRLLLLG
jgi:PAS domain-containing protein